MALTQEQVNKLRNEYNFYGGSTSGQSAPGTVGEIMGGFDFRTGQEPQKGIFSRVISDIPSDMGQAVGEVVDNTKKAFGKGGQVSQALDAGIEGKQGLLRSFGQAFGAGAGSLSKSVGSIFTGLGKTILTPEAEQSLKEKVQPVAETVMSIPAVQNLIKDYETMTPEQKRDVDALFGVGSLATELASLGIGGRGIQAGKQFVGEGTKKVGNLARQTQELLGGITKTGTDGIREATTKAISPANIMQRVARITKGKQAKFEQMAGESVGDYLVNRGIFGNIDEITSKLYNRFTTSKSTADDALDTLKGTYTPTPVKTALKELLSHETKVSTPGALSKDFKRVRELSNKLGGEGLSMSEINEVKRLYEKNVKLDFLKQNLPESVSRANNIDSAIRNWQFGQAEKLGLKNLPDINRETRLAKQLLDDLGKEYAGSAGNNAITLSDWVILSGGDPTAIGGFLAKKTLSSKGVQSSIAKKLSGEAKIGIPKAEFGEPTVDGFLEFIKKNPPN